MKRLLNALFSLLIFSIAPALAEQNWEIATGCSGGVTGGGRGIIVFSDGKIYQWQAPKPMTFSKELLGEIECGVADALHSRLKLIKI